MDLSSSIAASRMVAQFRAMDVTAANIANAGTPGYKTQRMQFADWLSRQSTRDSVAYTQDRATWREQQQGTLTHTGNPFDLAISNDGYFTVNTPRGPRLTRDGRFGLMPNGTVADGAGNPLLDSNGRPIQLSTTDTRISIAGDGAVSSENGQLGRIGVVRPRDAMRMTAEGATLMRADVPTDPVTAPALVQGAKEESNVQPVLEVTRMMSGLRDFQYLGQFLQAEADRQQGAIDKLLPRSGG